MSDHAVLAVATGTGIFGAGLLRLSWQRVRRSNLMNACGWAAIIACCLGWATMAGGARGAAVGVSIVITAALCLVALPAYFRREGASARQRAGAQRGRLPPRETRRAPRSALDLPGRIWTFLLCGPLAAIVATLVSIGGLGLLARVGVEEANRIAVSLSIAAPIWAALVAVMLMTVSRWHRTAILAVAGLAGIIAIFSANY